jgi:multicomponent Na+:H+ antiporter subunit E
VGSNSLWSLFALRYTVSLFLVLLAVWLGWSGHYVPLLIGLGLLSILGVLAIGHRMRVIDHESAPIEMAARVLAYIPWLLWQILLANIHVGLRILNPRLPISPRIVRAVPSQRGDMGRVIYANSITLTPGTVSLNVEPDCIMVHALTAEAAEELLEGDMDRRVTRAEGRR